MPEAPSPSAIVCDTTVLLYLGRIGQARLLPALFTPVYVPEAVALELDMGRTLRSDTLNPRILKWAALVDVPSALVDALPANRLGIGERSVIAYARVQSALIAGLDDLQARELAESLGLVVVGTLGVILRAKRAGLIPATRPLFDALIPQGFRLGPDLYRAALALANETP